MFICNKQDMSSKRVTCGKGFEHCGHIQTARLKKKFEQGAHKLKRKKNYCQFKPYLFLLRFKRKPCRMPSFFYRPSTRL